MSEFLMAQIVDAATGESYTRLLTEDELAQLEEIKADEETRQAEAQAKAEARQSALAKLAALGLTEEEVAAL